jgi:hypothetical protein
LKDAQLSLLKQKVDALSFPGNKSLVEELIAQNNNLSSIVNDLLNNNSPITKSEAESLTAAIQEAANKYDEIKGAYTGKIIEIKKFRTLESLTEDVFRVESENLTVLRFKGYMIKFRIV